MDKSMLILTLSDNCSLRECQYKGIRIATEFVRKTYFNRGLAITFSVNSIIKLYILPSNLSDIISLVTVLLFLKNNEKINIFNKQWFQK